MQRLSALLSHLALGLLLLGAVGMIGSMLLGVADVVGTQFFDTPVPGALEVTESTMVLIVFGALAYAQIGRAHIRVELLYGITGPRAKSFMDFTTHLVAFAFFALLAWQGLGELRYSWDIREATMGTVRFPLYPARFLLLLGTVLLLVQLALDMIADLGRLRRGEAPPAPPLAGALGGESAQVR
jgi:TRAP-type mannitol/chloroaromatic compound transport system permease small subunit